ncbi:MAG: hypothetical protein J6U00_12130 [Ruminococcus sp.]|uniref:hypothetical protein n=1 Tax=Ruminococcus sp. TaxID=41978 RepID=UPI001B07EED9|nr:hypothetical protein [Ruminococcus sp.]MBO7474720.1 hypothetical protein [Ruminococcus sp.]
MKVNFFEIKNCTMDSCCGYPAIFAPEGTDEGLLMMRGFTKQINGTWFRYLNQYEYDYVMQFSGYDEVTIDQTFFSGINMPPSQQSEPIGYKDHGKTPTVLCYVSLGIMLLAVVLFGIALHTYKSVPLISEVIPTMIIASFILVIIVRINYPESTLGKVLFTVYIVTVALLFLIDILSFLAFLVACNEFLNSCR